MLQKSDESVLCNHEYCQVHCEIHIKFEGSNQDSETVWSIVRNKKTVASKRKMQHLLLFYILHQSNCNKDFMFSEELLPYNLPHFCAG